jgi:competence protein ComEC
VVMGRQDVVDPATVAALRRSGTAHILSVGGMHLAALAAVMLAGVRLARGPRLLGYVLGGGAAWLFVPLVGASPPVMRAAVVLAFVLVAEASGRGRDRWQIFAAAAALTLALNPFSLYSLSFQLSFAAAAGLMLLTRPVQRRLAFLPSALSAGVATSVAATLATAPLSLLAFDQVALMGVVANLLVVPVLPAVMAASLASIAVGFASHSLSAALNVVSATCMAWVAWVAQLAARGPVLTSAGLAPAMAAAVGGLLAWAGLRRRGRRDIAGCTGPARRRPTRQLSVAVVAVGMLAGLLAVHAYGRVSAAAAVARGVGGWPAQTEVRVLDVGEGSATLIRTADRHAILVDAGPPGAGIAQQLQTCGVKVLDVVVITHPHADHYGGLAELAGAVRISTIADHVQPSGRGSEYARVVEDSARTGTRHVLLADGETLALGGAQLQVRAPPSPLDATALGASAAGGAGAAGADGATLNAASLVVTVRAGGLAILLPGDAEAPVLEQYGSAHVDVLVVPHHGSRAAVSARLLQRLSIRLAIVPVGPNSFGHPAAQTLATLTAAKVSVLRTDRAGWVAIGAEDGRVAWQRAAGGEADTAAAVK